MIQIYIHEQVTYMNVSEPYLCYMQKQKMNVFKTKIFPSFARIAAFCLLLLMERTFSSCPIPSTITSGLNSFSALLN